MRFCLENLLKTALLTTSRKTERGAKPFLTALVGRAAPFALLMPLAGSVVLAGDASPETPHVVSVVRSDARTGRLVRVVVSRTPAPSAKPDPAVVASIEETARNLEVSPELVHSVIEVESNYNPYAVSPKGAEGLMQLMPATARRFGVTNSFDARQNIEGGVRYLKFLKETFGDDRLAIAAYNAGEKAVTRYGGVPPYPETLSYVAKVGEKYRQAKKTSETKGAAKPAQQRMPAEPTASANPTETEQRHVAAYLDAEGRLHIATR
jgi:Transglycosylase SLT domain